MIPTIWHSGKDKTMETVKRSAVAKGWGAGEGWIGGVRRIFWAVKYSVWYHNDGYMSLYMSKLIECAKPRVNCNVNYGLWVIMMCWHRFISCNKWTAVLRDVDNGGGRENMEISVPFPQVCSKAQTALKKFRLWH